MPDKNKSALNKYALFKVSDGFSLSSAYLTKYTGLLLGIDGLVGADKIHVSKMLLGGLAYCLGSLVSEAVHHSLNARQLEQLEQELYAPTVDHLTENNLSLEEEINRIIKS